MKNKIIQKVENRAFPRIKTKLLIRTPDGVTGEVVNMSEGGICFSLEKPMRTQKCPVIIELPTQPVKVEVQLKWNGGECDKDRKNFYGAKVATFDSTVNTALRRYMVSRQFRHAVIGIKKKIIRKEILKLAKNFRDYLFKLAELSSLIERKRVNQEDILRQLTSYTNEIVLKCDEMKGRINDKLIVDMLKSDFRALVGSWAYKSHIVKRGLDKPRGYPGDYRLIEVIYDKQVCSIKDNLGYYFDLYFLNNPYAEAVRNRKDRLRDILKEYLSKREGQTKILNVACGSCREIRELFENANKSLLKKDVNFLCLDWDEDALNFSREKMKNLAGNIEINFIKENVMVFVKNDEFFKSAGKQDMIYSIGLADYMPDRILKKMIKNLLKGLNKGGRFIIAHKDKEIIFPHLPPEWFCDWVFFDRNEKDLVKLIKEVGIDNYTLNVEREKSGQIFFITLTKES